MMADLKGTKMARGRLYTEAEDAIVFRESNWREVNRLLLAAGFEERSEASIKQRRADLRKKGWSPERRYDFANEPDEGLRLRMELRAVRDDIEACEREADAVEARCAALREREVELTYEMGRLLEKETESLPPEAVQRLRQLRKAREG